MKRTLLIAMCVIGSAAARAYDYPYLVFQTADGTATSVDVSDLTISVNGTELVVTNSSGTQTFTLSDLSKMYFSETSGIADISSDKNAMIEVYSLSGNRIGTFDDLVIARKQLEKGIYIVKTNGQTSKISIQ